jgi:hypothetical protein
VDDRDPAFVTALREELSRLLHCEQILERERLQTIDLLGHLRKHIEQARALLEEPANAESRPGECGSATSTDSGFPANAVAFGNVADMAHDILRERGREPMHYRELGELVRARGGDLTGPNPAQTLVARLAKDARFVRPQKRGYYSLREFYPRSRSVGSRKKRVVSAKKTSPRSAKAQSSGGENGVL